MYSSMDENPFDFYIERKVLKYLKNLARNPKIILLNYQNNYIGRSIARILKFFTALFIMFEFST